MTVEHFTASDGASVGYRIFGDGARLITAVHSLSLDGSWYGPLAQALGEDYRVICPDVRGHGSTGDGPAPMTLRRVAQDVIELWDLLGVEASVVLGVSMGGMVAQAVAAEAPEIVEALVLVATGGGFDEGARTGALQRLEAVRAADDLSALVQPLLKRWFGPAAASDDPLVAQARATLESTPPHRHAAALEAMLAVGTFHAPEAPVPTLVVAGEDDVSSTREVAEALAAKYPGSQVVALPGPHLFAFTQPYRLAEVVSGFLAKDSSSSPSEPARLAHS